jgi:hypothetical protein
VNRRWPKPEDWYEEGLMDGFEEWNDTVTSARVVFPINIGIPGRLPIKMISKRVKGAYL